MTDQPELTSHIVSNNDPIEPVFNAILDKLNAAKSESASLLDLLNQQNLQGALSVIDHLQQLFQEAAATVTAAMSGPSEATCTKPNLKTLLERARTQEMLDNIDDSLQEMRRMLKSYEHTEQLQPAIQLCELQLIPFLRITSEACYFWGIVDHNPQLKQQYYATEFAFNHRNTFVESGESLPYQVTIVVVAYNKLDMTRRCLESILQNTDFERLQCELVLVDHGSTDGTLEYFKSVPNARVVHLKRNVMLDMFTMLPMICRSPFLVTVCNDTVATKDWLDTLLSCMRSDPSIVLASPAASNMGNNQDLIVPANADCETVVALASKHNKVNPLLWRERAQVFPAIGIFNLSIINQIGFWDRAIYSFYFSDTDFSLHARRAGFKQILCEDVICYHQGSGTMSKQSKSLIDLGAKLFKQKNGIEPVDLFYSFKPLFVEHMTEQRLDILRKQTKDVNILAIDCGFGDTALLVKNVFKQAGITAHIYHITTHPEFVADIRPFASGIICTKAKILALAIQASFPEVVFDYVFTDSDLPINRITPELLAAVKSRLTADGEFAFFTPSPYYYKQLKLDLTVNPNLINKSEQSLNHLLRNIYQYFSSGSVFPHQVNNVTKEKVLEFLAPHFTSLTDEKFKELTTFKYCIVARR